MPPATSPWTFLVPALGAFLGVVIAQWWTSRREKRQWERQMQMYATQWADQRERDREQREDQRERDREMWLREDRHRFTEHKRDLYASAIAQVQKVITAMRFAIYAIDKENERREAESDAPLAGFEPWLNATFPSIMQQVDDRNAADSSLETIQFLAPAELSAKAFSLQGKLLLASTSLDLDELADAKVQHEAAVKLLREVKTKMREDLSLMD